MEKYARNDQDRKVLRHLITSLPFYAEQRITFEKFAGSNYKSREVSKALRSLEKARLISLIYPLTNTSPPPVPNQRKKPRLQFLDSGLVVHKLQNHREVIELKDLNDAIRGRIAQQVVAQNILANHSSVLYQNKFWVREIKGDAEVDLVYPFRSILIPIEIKSGATGKLRSLMEFIDRCDHHFAVRMYGGTFSIQNIQTIRGKKFTLMNLPYYLSGQLTKYLDLLIKTG